MLDCLSCSSSQLWKEFLQFIASSSRRSKGKKLKNVDDMYRGSVLESLFTRSGFEYSVFESQSEQSRSDFRIVFSLVLV